MTLRALNGVRVPPLIESWQGTQPVLFPPFHLHGCSGHGQVGGPELLFSLCLGKLVLLPPGVVGRGGSSQTPMMVSTLLASVPGCCPSHLPSLPTGASLPARSLPPPSHHWEDKWPHSGTPCQSCLSKTELCVALHESQLVDTQRASRIGGCQLQEICDRWLPPSP